MRKLIVILFICTILSNKSAKSSSENSQIINICSCEVDSLGVVKNVDVSARYKNIDNEISSFFNQKLLSDTTKNIGIEMPPSKIKIIFIIDSVGNANVYSINKKVVASKSILSEFEKIIINSSSSMKDWTPAICDEKYVNSYYKFNWFISWR